MPAPNMPLVKLNDAPANDAPRMSWPAFIAIVVWPAVLGTGSSMTCLDSPLSVVNVAVGRSPLLLLILFCDSKNDEQGSGEEQKKKSAKEKEKKKVSQSISHSKEKETQIGRNKRSFHFLPKCSQKIEEKGENSNLFAMVIPHLAHTSESEKKTSQEPCVSVMGRKDERGGEKAKNEELPFKKREDPLFMQRYRTTSCSRYHTR